MNGARQAVIAAAVTWIGTPFHHAARVKGAGVDCLMLLAEVYERAGVAPRVEPPFYVPDWHMPWPRALLECHVGSHGAADDC